MDVVLDDEWIRIECVAAFFGAGVAIPQITEFFEKAQRRSLKSAGKAQDFSYYLTPCRAPFDNSYLKHARRRDLDLFSEELGRIVDPHPIKIPSDLYSIIRRPKVALLYSDLSTSFFQEDYSMAHMSFIRLVLSLNFLPRKDVMFSVSQCEKLGKRNIFYLLSILESRAAENQRVAQSVSRKIYKPSTRKVVPKKERVGAAKTGSKGFAEENI